MPDTAIIDEQKIAVALEKADTDHLRVRDIIDKAREMKGLEPLEAASLLKVDDNGLVQEIFRAAREVKLSIYGKRLVLFAPLYVSDYCNNNCLYCAFRHDNPDLVRRTLTLDDVEREVRLLEDQGHKRLLMLMGEDSTESSLDYFVSTIERAYATHSGKGEIRRINVEIAPQSVEGFRQLKAARIGTYVVFQETYHRPTYELVHPVGKKADYEWRLTAMDRAMQAGIDDVGIGVLFGLHDYRFEVLAMLMHARYLDRTYGVGPHTISVPRIYPAKGASLSYHPLAPVNDDQFKRLVAVLRLSVPYTGMILSTRESPELRHQVFDLGISQISAGSRTNPGGYASGKEHSPDDEQFSLGDTRPVDEVIRAVVEQGYIPSFCTGCYRLGRTGQDFMDLAKPGLIQEYCLPNALLTFQEYLEDYASESTRIVGGKLARSMLMSMPSVERRKATMDRVARVKAGERDLFFQGIGDDMPRAPREGILVVTYRCNAKCHMCNTWQHPSDPKDEIRLEHVERLPSGLEFLNITGGEPFLRSDVEDIIGIARRKARRIVISTNGYFTDRIVRLVERFPDIGIRISLEGLPSANDELRGISDGFDHGLRTILRLKRLNARDIGFGITVSDRNAKDLLELYELAKALRLEFATAAVHSGYYFHKMDNVLAKKDEVADCLQQLIHDQLRSWMPKKWFRAYFNHGLINYVYGGKRLLPCEMGSEIFLVDPFGEVRPCNALEISMGNIKEHAFADIWASRKADEVRQATAHCGMNCWMIGSVSPAIKKHRLKVVLWIIRNKLSSRPVPVDRGAYAN